MDEKNENTVNNNFLSRGCSAAPRIYDRNDNIYSHGCCKLDSCDWLADIPIAEGGAVFPHVEIRFKNSRLEFFTAPAELELEEGDIVAVEGSPGHDIGIVSLTGEAAKLQMKKKKANPYAEDLKKVYRRARVSDIEKWLHAVDREEGAKFKTREIAGNLKLEMKINDVEYQGDGTKATFYYTAEERVDFRELIKLLADEFKVRIEMRQIGVRQEASRLGGIGSCGRELCCSTWMSSFKSVSTSNARLQQLSLNPQKLAGQCGKLKCCLNFESEMYEDALKEFPSSKILLKTKKGNAVHHKNDVFKQLIWYSYENERSDIMAIPLDKVKSIIQKNEKGILPDKLEDFAFVKDKKVDFENAADQDDLKRFD
ncbi:MAG: regulatory iron-sulfur-containing complex subunit RicT [Bacteroidales bacterium]|nr:regulatory iron-sulfur-containing complex subunit RicT [Bacteroidales bacterium]